MRTPVLLTKRILLHPLGIEDAETCYRNWTSDPEVAKYMRWSAHKSVEETMEWLAIEEMHLEGDESYNWGFVLRSTGELFGSGGLAFDAEQGLYELGYCIMRKYWNMGLTTEAAQRIVQFAKETLGVKALIARHARENPASGRVMMHVGFVQVGEGTMMSFDGKKRFETLEYKLTF